MAALITALAVSGSRKSDGTVNASGKVYLYSPGTTTIVAGYQDEDLSAAWPTVSGGIALDTAGKVKIWVNDPVDVVVTDSSGTTVDTFLGFNRVRAEQVEIESDNFTGALEDSSGAVSQALGGKTDLLTVIERAAASIGDDFKYLESPGATAVNVQDFLRGIWISVKQFGAVGDGVADDTAAIQLAINRVKALGGGVVYFPPGTYKVSSALTLSSGTGVSMVGVRRATTISQSGATSDLFTFSTASTKCGVYGLRMMHATSTSGAAVNAAAAVDFVIKDCEIIGGDFTRGCDFSGATNWEIASSVISGTTNAIRSNISATGLPSILYNSQVSNGAGTAILLDGAGGDYLFIGGSIGGVSGVVFNASFTGGNILVLGCQNQATTKYDHSAISADPNLRRFGDGVDGYTEDVASGGTFTPNLAKGRHIRMRATSTGDAITIAAPTPVPTASQYGFWFVLDIFNNAGGAMSHAYSFNAAYRLASTPSQTNLEHNVFTLYWDPSAALWRQRAYDVTL